MKAFMDKDFLLTNETAITLYHQFAKDMPILDYHCHLSPQEIYENKSYKNLTEAWLYGDHYKWRAMRGNGIDEQYITGATPDYDRFLAYARTMPKLIGNPLYHWSHLELRRFFEVEEILNERNAPIIWEKVNAKLVSSGFRARDLIMKSNVRVIGTTDDPTDSLEFHMKIKEDPSFDVAVLPTFRPDKALEINRMTFVPWLKKLGSAAGIPITSYDDLLQALELRVRFFHSVGCRISDHDLGYVPFALASKEEVSSIFAKGLYGHKVTMEEEMKYKTSVLVFLASQYAELNWTMQYHMHVARDINVPLFRERGGDIGNDSIQDSVIGWSLRSLLSEMSESNGLPKTILYSLNPQHFPVLATIAGAFQGGGIPSKIQLGSAWWFNDTKEGMIHQMKVLADIGLLGCFVGMLTDSRSFLSFSRHEYFRRILCNLIGEWAENGELPHDMELLGSTVQNISYNNAKQYFQFPESQ